MALQIATEAYGVAFADAYLKITRFTADYRAPVSAVEFEVQVFANEAARQAGTAPLTVTIGQCAGEDITAQQQAGDVDPRQPVYRWLIDQYYPTATNV